MTIQFEVLEYRLKNEYGVEISKHPLSYRFIRWVEMDNFDARNFSLTMDSMLVEDKNQNPVLLFQNEWSIRHIIERNDGIVLREHSL